MEIEREGRQEESIRAIAQQRLSMLFSLGVGVLMFVVKIGAYAMTGSLAILSDAAESVVHVVAVSFATYSLWLSHRPVDKSHPYGHEKIAFFSAGFEGAMIVLAACYIIYAVLHGWFHGLRLEHLGIGAAFTAGAAILNGALGTYLIWQGKKRHSLILEADGKHVLTDAYTSAGVIVGLVLVLITGWLPFDPILAILVAMNILWSGGKLIRRSIAGLMDEVDPQLESVIEAALDRITSKSGIRYHGLRYRNAGNTVWIEFHLLFPRETTLEEAHAVATRVEETIEESLPMPVKIISHLETSENHETAHKRSHILD